MPYKDPERKRQWEQQHREQRNARREIQRQAARSGHASVSNATSDIVAALRTHRTPPPDPASGQKPQSTWKTILGWAVGIGVVLLAVFASVSLPTPGDLGASPGSGDSGIS